MATKIIYLSGIAKYPKLKDPTPDFDKTKLSWKTNLYFDEKSKEIFERSELKLKVKTDSDGSFTTFRRPTKTLMKDQIVEFEPPTILDKDNKPTSTEVTDGSKVTLKLVVYDSRNGKGHRLEAVRIDELGSGGPSVDAPDDVVPF